MFSKDSLATAKAVLDNCNKAKDDAHEVVNTLLDQHKNEIIVLNNPAYILVDGGEGWVETPIHAVKMNDDDLILLSKTSMISSATEINVWEEDNDNININWPSLLEALIRTLSKDNGTKTQKHSYSANITLRIDYESDRELDGEDIVDIVGNLDIETVSRTRGVDIVSTEICGINE